jgi:hypothetical protein
MAFVEAAGLVLDAVEFLAERVEAGDSAEVHVTSDSATYPKGSHGATNAPLGSAPVLRICFNNPFDEDTNLAEVPLVARAHFGGLGTYMPAVDPALLHYEIANCLIGYDPIVSLREVTPALTVDAKAQETPVIDNNGQPAIEWVISVRGERASGDHVLLAGKLDFTLTVRVGCMGNVEREDLNDHSDPAITVQDSGPLGIFAFVSWQVIPL